MQIHLPGKHGTRNVFCQRMGLPNKQHTCKGSRLICPPSSSEDAEKKVETHKVRPHLTSYPRHLSPAELTPGRVPSLGMGKGGLEAPTGEKISLSRALSAEPCFSGPLPARQEMGTGRGLFTHKRQRRPQQSPRVQARPTQVRPFPRGTISSIIPTTLGDASRHKPNLQKNKVQRGQRTSTGTPTWGAGKGSRGCSICSAWGCPDCHP